MVSKLSVPGAWMGITRKAMGSRYDNCERDSQGRKIENQLQRHEIRQPLRERDRRQREQPRRRRTQEGSRPPSYNLGGRMLEAPSFDGEEDAYGWLICLEKYFQERGTPEEERLKEAVSVLRGAALKWWSWWGPRYPQASWLTFMVALLCHFKPEYRDVLPYSDGDEEEEPEWVEPEFTEEEKDTDGRGDDGFITSNFYTVIEIETHREGELKATKEFSKEEEELRAMQVAEIGVEDDGGVVSGLLEMKMEKGEGRHLGGGRGGSDDGRCIGGSDLSKGDDGRYEGGGRGCWVEKLIGGGHVQPPESPKLSDGDVPMEKSWTSPSFQLLPPDWDVLMEKGGTPPTFRLPPLEPPESGVHMEADGCLAVKAMAVRMVAWKPRTSSAVEEGATPPTFFLPPPEPLDMGVYVGVDGPFIAAEGGSFIAVVVKLSSLPIAEMTIACERKKWARAAVEKVGQTLANRARPNSAPLIEIAGRPSSQQVLKKGQASTFHGWLKFVYDRGKSCSGIEEVNRT